MKAINIYNGTIELCEGFTRALKEITRTKEGVSISLSGGSTPKALFDFWAEKGREILPWESMKFFWGDERCVGAGDPMSNYGMTYRHLFSRVPVPKENIFRIIGEEDPAKEAERYSNILRKELHVEKGMPQFDIMILGLGDDGHTASIFPQQMELWDSENYCVVAKHPESGMKRISLTGGIINHSESIFFLVTGENKAEKVREIAQRKDDFREVYPAARVNPSSGRLFWFLDKAAARLLN